MDKSQRAVASAMLNKKSSKDRPEWDEYFMNIAKVVSSRGSCIRRQVGCVLINSRNQIIATGYNGKARGLIHCFDDPCKGAYSSSGTKLGDCSAIHAEANALLQCSDVYNIHKAYITTAPCVDCTKLFLNTSCEEIVYLEEYPHSQSKEMWENDDRIWTHFKGDGNA